METQKTKIVEIGQRFGKLVVVDGDHSRKNRYRAALCRCDCGSDHVVRVNLLLSGRSSSCGCGRKEVVRTKGAPGVRENLTGSRFGRLLIVGDSGDRSKSRQVLWRCLCDCGSEKLAPTSLLTSGMTKSCGCLQREQVAERMFVDHSGKRFGLLTALRVESRGGGYAKWVCACDCGNETVVRSNALTQGETVSCGCASGMGVKVRGADVVARAGSRTAKRRARLLGAEGSFTPKEVEGLYRLQRGRCAWCGIKLDAFHRDHRTALSNGGSNDIKNIEILCGPCNLRKGAKDEIAWANENGKLC